MNEMKRNLGYFALVLAGAMTLSAVPAMGQASMLPMFKQQESETVTIPREEYDELLKFQKLDMLLQMADTYYYEEIDEDAMLETAAAGLMAGLGDVYSMYYTAEQMDSFNEETEGTYQGIGCQLLADPTDGLITVTRVFKGSPAEKAGIRAGDKIVYVNDLYYSAYEMDEAVDVMRGEPGGSVKVTVMRDLETVDFDVVREEININYVEYQILDGNIGYVMIYDFQGNAVEGFAEALEAFKAANVTGMIIDLRNNGGGLLNDAVDMADMILPEGVVVTIQDKNENVEEFTIDDEYYQVPMVVLVNEYTASASEILAGAIRDREAGQLVGTKTFGKGVVQNVFEFPDGSGMKITSGRYYTPNGECIHEFGIEPDVVVELDEDAVTLYGINNLPHEEDLQLQKAVELLGGTMDFGTETSAESADAQPADGEQPAAEPSEAP